MEIKAVKFRKDGFYTQPFVMGGEESPDKFDRNIRYRGSLQNYLIDTGSEVILVDTGLPTGTPEEAPDENSPAYTGKDICSYMDAFAALGYKPEQVTKILLTHRHNDHSGELRSFPNAKVYVNKDEMDAAELQGLTNLVPVSYTDGPYYNFPECQKIADGIYLIKAKGHTKGNSIVVVENNGLFYMLHGDITYVDEALYEDKLSVVFDDLSAAHELKTPVASIQGYLETVLTHPDISDEMRQQFLVQCFGQAQRLASILQDMATLNKIDAAPMTYKFEEVNISQIVEQVLDASALQLEEHQMHFDNQLPATLMARADASLVHSIFRNLTDNAISYAGDGTTITLTHSDADTHWQFTFSDNGVGIPAEHLSRIFERFYRVDKGRSRKLGGTGLGLAIVKNAVQLHGGMIAAFQNKDGGVRFVFTIRKSVGHP